MNENIDLTKILKNCPKGTKLYSTVFGYVIFQGIVEGVVYPIVVSCENGVTKTFTADGKMFIDFDGECTLFPSKEQRNWVDFIAPWYKKERFDPKTLTAFDKVLVFDSDRPWTPLMFSYLEYTLNYPRMQCFDFVARKVIPYNDDTKHLVGTKEEAPVFYRYWED